MRNVEFRTNNSGGAWLEASGSQERAAAITIGSAIKANTGREASVTSCASSPVEVRSYAARARFSCGQVECLSGSGVDSPQCAVLACLQQAWTSVCGCETGEQAAHAPQA